MADEGKQMCACVWWAGKRETADRKGGGGGGGVMRGDHINHGVGAANRQEVGSCQYLKKVPILLWFQ